MVELWPGFACLYGTRAAEFEIRVKRDQTIQEIPENSNKKLL